MNITYVVRGLAGMIALCLLAWLFSENKKQVRIQQICGGLLIQLVIAVLLLKLPFSKDFFLILNKGVLLLQEATQAGTSFAFGYIGGGNLPFTEPFPGAGFILAFQALPIILVMSALSALLTYWRILPALVRLFSGLFQKTMGIGGALAVGAAANIFIGMIESPLLIKPYLSRMTRSELFATMTCGMATIAGTVLVLYVTILDKLLPDAAGHVLTASIISVPAAITVARIMIPESEDLTEGDMIPAQEAGSSMEAVTKGTADGVGFFLHITAMLIVLVSLVHLVNLLLGLFPDFFGAPVTMQRVLGYVMAPVAWLMGIPWQEAVPAGSLIGIKTVLNEFLAYMELAKLPEHTLSPRSLVILTYALCGFANFGSLGIMIGGMGAMVPERKDEIVALGIRSIIAGTLATCLTGATVGVLYV